MDPIISVVMANHNGARFLSDAIASVLAQTAECLELIVSDDASDDDSLAIVRNWAERDRRVRLLTGEVNAGPGAARNRAFDRARGEWFAVVDADDLLHPERFERMLAAAGDADLVADNMLVFHDQPPTAPRRLLSRLALRRLAGKPVDLATFARANGLFGGGPPLGFLKPMIRLQALRSTGIRYDPSLRVAEDYDLVARLLASGCTYRIHPAMTYFYRKHGASISHRLSRRVLEPMLSADDRFRVEHATTVTPQIRRALDWRRRTILEARAFEDIVAGLRTRSAAHVLTAVLSHPAAALRLRQPLLDRARRAAARPPSASQSPSDRPIACVISRQRVVGATNGSSAYLLALAGSLADLGYDLHLISPSPATFGRWPALPLGPEMSLFRSVAFRGGIKLGSTVLACHPRTLWRAVVGASERALQCAGIDRKITKAPYAIALPWADEDLLFVAAHSRGASLVVADYAFGTEAIAYVIGRERSLVVMHDLFSSMRPGSLVSPISIDDEMRMLARADATIAIQEGEAAAVRAHLPHRRTALVPMPADPVEHAQPGIDGRVLFVGSDTAPNREGVAWFLDTVWPLVLVERSDAVLDIAGSVCASVAHRPANVRLQGRVDCLATLYRDAAVVVSPLKTGTGLKIKLVEALAQGKALVVTAVTLQGVEELARDALREADDPRAFADAVLACLDDTELRTHLGERALAVARRRFGRAACLETLDQLLRRPSPKPRPNLPAPILIEEDA